MAELTLKDFVGIHPTSWELKSVIKRGLESYDLRNESKEDNLKILPLIEKADIKVYFGRLSKRSDYYDYLKPDIRPYYNACFFLAVGGYNRVEIVGCDTTKSKAESDLSFSCCYSHYADSCFYRAFRSILGIEADFPKVGTEEERRRKNTNTTLRALAVLAGADTEAVNKAFPFEEVA